MREWEEYTLSSVYKEANNSPDHLDNLRIDKKEEEVEISVDGLSPHLEDILENDSEEATNFGRIWVGCLRVRMRGK